jgi:hypothetical protein
LPPRVEAEVLTEFTEFTELPNGKGGRFLTGKHEEHETGGRKKQELFS